MDHTFAAQGSQSPDHTPRSWTHAAAWTAGWGSVLALATWMVRLSFPWLGLVVIAPVAWALLVPRVGRAWRAGATLALLAVAGIAALVQLRLSEVAREWDRVRFEVEERAADDLGEGLDDLFNRGSRAVDGAARAAGSRTTSSAALFQQTSRVQRETGVTALAVYDAQGTPLAWSGEHRGAVPDSVRLGRRPSSFSAGPLFGYVYFTRPFGAGRTAVAAILLEAHVDAGEGITAYADDFEARHGITPRFTTPELAQGQSLWDWSAGDTPILSVGFAALTQERWRERIVGRGRAIVGAAGLAAALLLTVVWFRFGAGPPAVPVGVLTVSLAAAPLGELTGAAALFSPLAFVLPIAGDISLGQLLILLAGASVWLLTRSGGGALTNRFPLAVRAVLAAGVFIGALAVSRSAVADSLLAGRPAGGIPLIIALGLLATVPLFALLRPIRSPRVGRWELLGVAVLVAAVLAVAVVSWWRPGRELPVWAAAAWGLPFALAAAVLDRARLGRGALLPWIVLGWIGGSFAVSHLWIAHLEAKLVRSERELARLGTEADPFLDFLLRQFAEKVLFYAGEGRQGVPLLYQSWVEAGLAEEGYEGRATLWEGARAAAELRLTEAELPADMVGPMLASARAAEEPLVERRTDVESVHYLLAVALPGGRTVSVIVPPRRHVGRSDPRGYFSAQVEATGRGDALGSLSLVPSAGTRATSPAPTRWLRVPSGWRSETVVPFPSGPVHAHLVVPIPSPFLLAVRGLLMQTLLLAVLTVLWAIARTLCGEPLGLASTQWGWVWTFRGRLTLALFAFFLLPMAVFGATAYRALSREVVRTATALANRSLAQAAAEPSNIPLDRLGRHVGADLLRYRAGVLAEGSSAEVIDLGMYPTWLPAEVHLPFTTGEREEALQEERRLGGTEFLIVYRRLAGETVLAAPTPIATGEVARRQRELTDVVLLTGLLGGALSVILSLFVGRAFSRPIVRLSGAAAAVGAGDLGVRLPARRRDEFGGLFRSFNQMVRGLRHTRAALLRETRRTEAIVAEAGTGVVALDSRGRVALINPRAAEVLGAEIPTGERIPEDAPLPGAVATAVRAFLASGDAEGAEEREVDGRVVRLRLRRLQSARGSGGVVLVVEDVTAEIRSARVLAWGEMARQVAHEIKNPLTPIKLSVQHIRRAHQDGREDFGSILDRNVDAILREIDRLGEIARAFARFGTPSDTTLPPEPVDVGRIADETLALYRGGNDGIEYAVEVEPSTPAALARVGELKEVLVNVLENARGALADGGAVEITVSNSGGGAWVQLDVRDTGEGIPEDLLPRIFEPQFSTRTSGTGLGLAIVRRLVDSWGGEVTVDSQPGVGTTVHLRLRVAPERG